VFTKSTSIEDGIKYYILKNTLSLKFASFGLDLKPLSAYIQEYDAIFKKSVSEPVVWRNINLLVPEFYI
jgi:hypothetical protein